MTEQERFARMLQKLLLWATGEGIRILLYQLYRTPEQQNVFFQRGASKADGYKKLSKHQNGLAADICVLDTEGKAIWTNDTRYNKLGQYWHGVCGGTWGGDWKSIPDIFHFEL